MKFPCVILCVGGFAAFFAPLNSIAVDPGYPAVASLFQEHCLDCHGATDPEGSLVLETYQSLLKGGESGAVIKPGKSAESILIQMVTGTFEKEGHKKIMPPGKKRKLTEVEVSLIKAWVDAGALPPPENLARKELMVPRIVPQNTPRDPIQAIALAGSQLTNNIGGSLVALGRYNAVELLQAGDFHVRQELEGLPGNINAIAFSPSGLEIFAGGGQPGLPGEIRQWQTGGTLVRAWSGHADAIYSLALAPDGKLLVTGSYDQKIKIWNAGDGQEVRTLSGHNGAVFDLAFRPDGKLLASASADRTVKLWFVENGERRETFSQSLKELFTVVFSPDGKRLAAGGGDNRIRVWQISETGAETTNPLLFSKFAHEGAVLHLAYSADGKLLLSSADDKTVKVWDAETMTEHFQLPPQPDWPRATMFLPDGRIAIGRMDGSLAIYSTEGKLLNSFAQIAQAVHRDSPSR